MTSRPQHSDADEDDAPRGRMLETRIEDDAEAPRRPKLRLDKAAEEARVTALYREAFGDDDASDLVARLREEGALIFQLVAEKEGALIAAAAFSAASIVPDDAAAESVRAAVLSPIAVTPEHRGQGVGVALLRAGLMQCRKRGIDAVMVLGPPRFFGKLGFSADAAADIRSPYAGAHFQAIRIRDDGPALAGAARYPDAFAAGPRN